MAGGGGLKIASSFAFKPFLIVIWGGMGAAGSWAEGRMVFLRCRPHLPSIKLHRQMSHAGVSNSCRVSRAPSQSQEHIPVGCSFVRLRPACPRMDARGSSWGPMCCSPWTRGGGGQDLQPDVCPWEAGVPQRGGSVLSRPALPRGKETNIKVDRK